MTVSAIVWVPDGPWAACVDAAVAWLPSDAAVGLLHVTDDEPAAVAHGAFVGLMGRGRAAHQDPGRRLEADSATAAAQLLDDAAARLGRPASRLQRVGRPGHEVVRAAEGADLLICARDGDPSRLGPHSIGPVTRFVVDHAPCAVLLVWPGPAPGPQSLPPPPPASPPAPPPRRDGAT